MPKYFIDTVYDDIVKLEGETAYHLKKVLRVRVGDKVILCDGNEKDYECVVQSIDPLTLFVESTSKCKNEPPCQITLYQGMLKSDKLEWIIQKSVELGVYDIVPVYTEHTVVRTKEDAKIVRYQKIAESAAGQSMRGIIPNVCKPTTLQEAVTQRKDKYMLVAHEKGQHKTIANHLSKKEKPAKIGIWIGPEGGFSEKEIELMISMDFIPINLGPRILRAETAAIAALAQTVQLIEADKHDTHEEQNLGVSPQPPLLF